MEDDRTTILLTGPAACRKMVFHKLAQKRRPARKGAFGTAEGTYTYMEEHYRLLELPAACTSDLHPSGICPPAIRSMDVGQDRSGQILFSLLTASSSAGIVVCDALFLEQGLAQLAQLIRLEPVRQKGLPLLLCICNCKEAQAQGVWIDYDLLEDVLQIPVLPLHDLAVSERDDLKAAVAYMQKRRPSYDCLDFSPKKLAAGTTHYTKKVYGPLEDTADRLLTDPVTGSFLLALLFFLLSLPALAGALFLAGPFADTFAWLRGPLSTEAAFWGQVFHISPRIADILVHGILHPVAYVLFVMLPPLAVYLPLSLSLEDAGLLPRAAFSADRILTRCGGCGRQCSAMSMSLCCHQAGVLSCRSIRPSGPTQERMSALLTTFLLPCSGRMPALLLITFLLVPGRGILLPALFLTSLMTLGIIAALSSSYLLTHTALRRFPSFFFLTLPPIRRPRLWKKVLPAALDQICLILGRAAFMAIFAGILIWVMADTFIQGTSLLSFCTAFLDPFARLLGLDGVILTAFILGAPADEITLPVMLMLYQAQGGPPPAALSIGSLSDLDQLLLANGWTWQTALSVGLFTLFHWPCASALAVIRQETGQLRWVLAAFILPTLWGILLCAGLSLLVRGGLLL